MSAEPTAKTWDKRIDITSEGIGEQDGCWVIENNRLHQIDPMDCFAPIHTVSLQCYKGNWHLVVITSQVDLTLWRKCHAQLCLMLNKSPFHEVVS